MNVHIDIESRSRVNLLTDGVYNYAQHESTDVLCVCWAIDGGPIESWSPDQGKLPVALFDAMSEGLCWAHNAAFERLMFKHCILPRYAMPIEVNWRCTAVLARSYGLPSSLADVAKFIDLPAQKSGAGMALIRKMSIPDKAGNFEHTPYLLAQMVDYCAQDVMVERQIHAVLPDAVNWGQYDVSERINDRGILVDVAFAKRASAFVEEEKAHIKSLFVAATGLASPGSINFTQQMYDQLRLSGDARKVRLSNLMMTFKKRATGEVVEGLTLASDVVDALLEKVDVLDERQRTALELKQQYARSSSSKFANMVARAQGDGRVRGSYLYLGAAKTGRYSARGLQMHNMPRDGVDNVDDYFLDAAPLSLAVLPALIRPTLYTEGMFVCSDWAGIEARALPWLADARLRNRDIKDLLMLFTEGGDIYVKEAQGIYGHADINKTERQIGKVAVLSLGYGGSVGAFNSMAKNYGVHLKEDAIKGIVTAWREHNSWAARFWKQLMSAALSAVEVPDSVHVAGRTSWVMEGDVLFCELPSGRRLAYASPVLEAPDEVWMGTQISCLKGSLKPAAGVDEWPRERLWGGLLAENVCQAVCADILNDALVRADAKLAVVGHTHDEIIIECKEEQVSCAQSTLESIMLDGPSWAKGLPLAVETWAGNYYRK